MMSLNTNARRPQRGFTLVEILVTLVVISVGLLGIAALQLTTLRGNQESYVRSQASVLANDIMDRMRANPLAVRRGEYVVELNETESVNPRAAADLTAWQASIDQLLPGGIDTAAGMIVRDGNVVTVTIQWRERPEGTGPAATENGLRSFSTRSEI
jgi:type IV pilus assembly protein PilV